MKGSVLLALTPPEPLRTSTPPQAWTRTHGWLPDHNQRASDLAMELHTVHTTFHHLGEEKHQMLNLNRRLESYLNRVKFLEEENALLVKEIQALRRSGHGAAVRRKGLEEELRQVRLEVDAAWRDRTHTELEVCRLSEELQALDQQRQMEAQAQVKARRAVEQSRKELEEEQRAQMWLREKVSQLEHEMKHLIQTHQEDVANLEATLTQSRITMPPTLAQRSNQGASVLQLGQEYYQRANRAWQEATEAYQGQLAHLEETLNQTRSRLTQVGQEKSESQLKLRALEKEISSAQDVRLHLEKAVVQRGHEYDQEVQQLQEHLAALEAERAELARQMERLVQENHGLMQAKMSLGLEVATYRALLDGESLRGDVASLNQPRNISDAVFSSQGVKRNYQSHLALSHKTASIPSLRSKTGAPPPAISASPAAVTETPKVPTTQSASVNTPYPKILHDGVFEDFRPQEVQEEVTYAEPLSCPEEQKVHAEATSENKEDEEDWSNVGSPEVVEQVVSSQAECGLGSEPTISAEVIQHQRTSPNLTPYNVRMKEESCGFSDESEEDVPSETPAEKKEEKQEPQTPSDAVPEKVSEDVEHVKEETSDSETEAVIEPNFESRTSSPVSEYELEESMLTKVADASRDETRVKDDEVQPRQEARGSFTERCEAAAEDKLYPDGEEMDTWDSVMEKKVDLKTSDGLKEDEEKLQHAEPEEDISTRAQEAEKKESGQDLAVEVPREDTEVVDTQVDHKGSPAALDLPRNEVDEDEDSQNVSVSWKTELESESYAQDNTLADTRPLIRYKSDETDGNTQASHVDESESSEGEQEKKAGELGAWAEGKSQRFGTMEDLCEEVEEEVLDEEVLDEEYELGYTHTEGRDVVLGKTEEAPLMKGTEAAEDAIRDNKERLDEGTEEPTESVGSAQPDVELETDRLVEQELENLDTFSYSAHFAQQQVSQRNLQSKSDEETAEEQNPMLNEHEPEEKIYQELTASTAMVDQPSDNLNSPVMDPEVPAEDQEVPEKREEEDEHNVSMVTHADETESPFVSRPDLEELSHSEEQNPLMQQTAEQGHLQEEAVLSESEDVVLDTSSESGGHLMEAIADCLVAPEPARWEVPENLSEDCELEDQTRDEDAMLEQAESPLHHTGAIMKEEEQPPQMSPDGAPDDIFEVTDSTEALKTNGKDDSLHTFFSSGVKSDFWASSLETGATYRPDDACNEEAEQVNQNLEFADNLLWGDLEKPDVVNWKSQLGVDSTKGLSIQKEQEQVQTGAKQASCRNVMEGEFVHSEESEMEAESWSSGEEPV